MDPLPGIIPVKKTKIADFGLMPTFSVFLRDVIS
jgi:hypothetical protein